MVTGWRPTEVDKPAAGTGGAEEGGEICGPGMAVVGITDAEVGETDGLSNESLRAEEGGEDTNGTVWPRREEVSTVGGMLEMLVVGTEVGSEAAETVWGWI